MNCGSEETSGRIKSGHSLASSSQRYRPESTATVFAPAAFPARTSLTESPAMMQSYISRSRASTHWINASGEGLGLLVSRAVTTWVKYFAMPRQYSSFWMTWFGTWRMVINASLDFAESASRVAEMVGRSFVFASVDE